NDARRFDTETAERIRRMRIEHENTRNQAELEKETALTALRTERERQVEESENGRLRLESQLELARIKADGEIALEAAKARSEHELHLLELERERLRAAIMNERTPASLQAQLVSALPEIVARLPKPDELRSVTINGNDATTVAGIIAELTGIIG